VKSDYDAVDESVVSPRHRRQQSLSPSRSPRSRSQSPARGRSVSPNFARTTYAAVQAAMHRRQLQVGELKDKLDFSRDQQQSLRRRLDEASAERHRLDQSVMALSDERQSL